jgi:hypothetical protein
LSTVGAKTGLEKVTTKRRVIEKSVVLFAGSNRAPRTHERVSKYQQAEANCDRRASRIAARGSMPEPGFRTPIGPVRETSVTSHAKKATRNPTVRRGAESGLLFAERCPRLKVYSITLLLRVTLPAPKRARVEYR